MKPRIKKAFSLIELSIVVLVIGILIAGIVSGSKLYTKFKVTTAQTLTRSSPVNGIKDLALWYETSLDQSFDSNKNFDGNTIYTWYDTNPQKSVKNNATQSTSCSTCATYKENTINGIPALYFGGGASGIAPYNDYMRINDNSVIFNTDFTIFMVGAAGSVLDSAGGWGTFLNYYDNPTTQYQMVFGYQGSTTLVRNIISTPSGADNGQITSFGTKGQNPIIVTAYLSQKDGRKQWLNGGNSTSDVYSPNSSFKYQIQPPASGKTGLFLMGRNAVNTADMYISEIIIFQRALSDEERRPVEKYLGQKYNIQTK